MKITSLYNIIVQSCEKALSFQDPLGAMPAGHNGPYDDIETPVRNTGHWLILFKKAYEISGNNNFRQASLKCLTYLLSDIARPMKATFWHRKKPEKDFTNGLIGQAWTIEALIEGYDLTKDDNIIQTAHDVFNLHPYDQFRYGWKIVNVDGSIRGFDYTYNHQLWFAAVGANLQAKLTGGKKLNGVDHFIENIHSTIQLYSDGVIMHHPTFYLKNLGLEKIKAFGSSFYKNIKNGEYIKSKSIGYHGFNLYALVMLDKSNPSLDIFNKVKIKKAVSVINNSEFRKALSKSKYGFPYNPAGIELAYVFDHLGFKDNAKSWLENQFLKTFNKEEHLLTGGDTFDKSTAAARLYEAVRISDYLLDLD
jgi:hypothetical protein